MSIQLDDPKQLPKDLVIFYCWQDHLNKKTHRFLIRDAINAAIRRLQDELPEDVDCVLRQDSDTSGRSGSVEIANTILQKISSSSVIIGDVTPVLYDDTNKYSYPNPNVMLELGYGARAVGWNKVILVFNTAGTKGTTTPESMPFDIRHRRLTPYACSGESQKAQAAKELEGSLVVALRAVLEEIGRGIFDPSLGDAALRRTQDVKLLRQLMRSIHRTTMDRIIERGTVSNVHYDGLLFWESFTAMMDSSHFRFHDKTLEGLAWKLHNVWGTAIGLGSEVLSPGNYPGTYVLLPEERWTTKYERKVRAMGRAYASMPAALKAFLNHVHTKYPELDLDVTDKAAWEEHLPYMTSLRSGKLTKNPRTSKQASKGDAPKKKANSKSAKG